MFRDYNHPLFSEVVSHSSYFRVRVRLGHRRYLIKDNMIMIIWPLVFKPLIHRASKLSVSYT